MKTYIVSFEIKSYVEITCDDIEYPDGIKELVKECIIDCPEGYIGKEEIKILEIKEIIPEIGEYNI